jgi:polysaccharide export outer membrane protein
MKRLPYLAEYENNQVDNLISFQKTQRSHRAGISDLLNIRAKALNQELTSIFHPIGNSKKSMETQEEIIYFDTFLKDRYGEIRLKAHTSFTAEFIVHISVENAKKIF